MIYITNAFSPKMLNPNEKQILNIRKSSYDEIQEVKYNNETISTIGHYNIAKHLGVRYNTMPIQVERNDVIYVVQCDPTINQYTYRKITIN